MYLINRICSGTALLLVLCGSSVLTACDTSDSNTKVNGSVHVAAGMPPADAKTVNGNIRVDDNGAVADATTVNGSIRLGEHATGKQLTAVNGTIELGRDAKSDMIKSVNGDLTLQEGSELSGPLTNVNGRITVTSAHIAGLITTVNADIKITGAARIDGGILVKKSGGKIFVSSDEKEPVIVIGPGATVSGELRFERKVKLYVSDKATIGTVTGATAQAFSGDTPPA